mmetsp:Transcript_93339/g.179486  ORF Transcript_93339/g.179486 Transcript_93339/m.179486 type:complete len:266 (-) Transcript_93339:42-839(-)
MPAILAILFIPFFYFLGVCAFFSIPALVAGVAGYVVLKLLYGLAKSYMEDGYEIARTRTDLGRVLPKLKTEEESKELVEYEKMQHEIEAEIAAVKLIAENMPKTLAEAEERLAEAKDQVKSLEATAATLEAVAKARSGGWGDVTEARHELQDARERMARASEDLQRFPKQITEGHAERPEVQFPIRESVAGSSPVSVSGMRSISSMCVLRGTAWSPGIGRQDCKALRKPLPAATWGSAAQSAIRSHRNGSLGLLGRPLLRVMRYL